MAFVGYAAGHHSVLYRSRLWVPHTNPDKNFPLQPVVSASWCDHLGVASCQYGEHTGNLTYTSSTHSLYSNLHARYTISLVCWRRRRKTLVLTLWGRLAHSSRLETHYTQVVQRETGEL